MKLSVSVVAFNSSMHLLQQTLESLQLSLERACSAYPGLVSAVHIIDNSDDPAKRAELRAWVEGPAQTRFEEIAYAWSGGNPGYGTAHNQAILAEDSDFHLVLNPDVGLDADMLHSGLDYLEAHPDVVLVSPQATDDEGSPQYLCKRYPSVLVLLLRAFAPAAVRARFGRRLADYEMPELNTGTEPGEAPLMSGCCMLARAGALRQVGGFSEDFFMYFEDFDLSLRLGALGRLVCLPRMKIVHHGGYSASKGMAHIMMFARSGYKFFRRHGWRWI